MELNILEWHWHSGVTGNCAARIRGKLFFLYPVSLLLENALQEANACSKEQLRVQRQEYSCEKSHE